MNAAYRVKLRSGSFGSVLIILLLLLSGCSDPTSKYTHDKLQIGTNIWPGYEPLYLAQELGYLDKKRVRLIEYNSASEVIRAFRNGLINAAALTLDEALLLHDQNFAHKVVLVLDISEGADVIIGDKTITSMSALKGKRIGVEDTALGAYVLTRALDLNPITLDMVKIVPMEVSEHEQALKDGLVDAVVTFEPVKTKLMEWGGNELFSSKQIPMEVVDVLIVEDTYFQKHQDEIYTLIDNWFKALSYLHKSPRHASEIAAKRQGITAQEFLASLDGLRLPSKEENIRMFDGNPSPAYENSIRLMKTLKEKSLILQQSNDTQKMFIHEWMKER